MDHPNDQAPGAPVRHGIPEHGRIPKCYAVKARLVGELGEGEAIRELVLEGKPRRGRGTGVAGPKLERPLALASHTEGVRRQGRTPGHSLVTLDRFPCPAALAAETGLDRGEPVWHLERVLLAYDERLGLESPYVAVARVPRLDADFDPDSSFYAFLQGQGIVAPRTPGAGGGRTRAWSSPRSCGRPRPTTYGSSRSSATPRTTCSAASARERASSPVC